jgi:hypothetical protein
MISKRQYGKNTGQNHAHFIPLQHENDHCHGVHRHEEQENNVRHKPYVCFPVIICESAMNKILQRFIPLLQTPTFMNTHRIFRENCVKVECREMDRPHIGMTNHSTPNSPLVLTIMLESPCPVKRK